MKLHKITVYISVIMITLSLFLSVLFTYLIDIPFISNIFIGIFSSATLTLIYSLLGYFLEKRRIITAIYYNYFDFLALISLNHYKMDNNYLLSELKKNINQYINSYSSMLEHEYHNFSVFLKKTKKNKLFSDCFQLSYSIKKSLIDDRNFILKFELEKISEAELHQHKFTVESEEIKRNIKVLLKLLEEYSEKFEIYPINKKESKK